MSEGSNSGNKFQNHNNQNNKRKFENKKPRTEEARKKFLVCVTYQKKHSGECFQKSGACYNCGKTGQLIRDCLELERGIQRLKVASMQQQGIKQQMIQIWWQVQSLCLIEKLMFCLTLGQHTLLCLASLLRRYFLSLRNQTLNYVFLHLLVI